LGYNEYMGILDNFENWLEVSDRQHENLSVKIFSETCCSDCLCENESKSMVETDNMGREKFWEDLGRP
jgi:hypothetical protein